MTLWNALSSRSGIDELTSRRIQTPGKSSQKCGMDCMKAGLVVHVWSFDELFEEVLGAG
jgi:hypothetical protein